MGKYDGLKKIVKKHVKGFGGSIESIVKRLAEEQAEEIAGYLQLCQKEISKGEDESEFRLKNEIGFVDNELGAVLANAIINHENEMLQDPSANIIVMEAPHNIIIKAKRFDEDCDVEEHFYNMFKGYSYVDDLMLTIKLSPNAIKYMDAIADAGKRIKSETNYDLFFIYMSDDIMIVEFERPATYGSYITEEDDEVKTELQEPIKRNLPVPNLNTPIDKNLLNEVDYVFRKQDYINSIKEGFDYLINRYEIPITSNLPDGIVSVNIDLGKAERASLIPTLTLSSDEVMSMLNNIHKSLNRDMIFVVRCFDKQLLNISIVDTDDVKVASRLIWDNEVSKKLIDETNKCELFIQVPNTEYVDMLDFCIIDDVCRKDHYVIESQIPIFFDDATIAAYTLTKVDPITKF